MDLAEIRKKAQQEQGRGDAPEAAGQELPDTVPGMFERIFDLPATVAGTAAPAPAQPPAAAPVAAAAPAPAVPDGPEAGFDPLAVILAGRRASAGELAETGAAAGAEAVDDTRLELLCFRIASEEYAINILDIKEIIKPREVTEVPRVPEFISGIISLRGIITPIVNMHRRLGLPPAPATGRERVVVVRRDGDLFGICVDEVNQVARIDAATLEPTPSVLDGINREFVSGIGRCDGRMLILLNLGKLLDVSLG